MLAGWKTLDIGTYWKKS